MTNDELDKLFPRDVYGRIALGLSSCALGPFSAALFGVAMYGEIFGGPHDWAVSLILIALGELGFVFTLFFICGLIWAVAMPKWLEGALNFIATKMRIAFFVSSLVASVFGIWLSFQLR